MTLKSQHGGSLTHLLPHNGGNINIYISGLSDPAEQIQHHQCGSYAAGREGAGLCGGPAAGVRVGAEAEADTEADAETEAEAEAEAEAGVGVVGEGWKLVGIGEVEDRRGSLGPAGDRAPPVLESALTFCNEKTRRD